MKLVIFSNGAGRDDSHTVGLRTVRDTREASKQEDSRKEDGAGKA